MKVTYKNEKLIDTMLRYMNDKTGLSIIVSVCLMCQECYNIKDGEEQYGWSHGYCNKCSAEALKKLKEETK